MRLVLFAIVCVSLVAAQDPPQGWLAYATAQCPTGTKLTKMTANWNVLSAPQQSMAFYSPWFGSDTSDNMNLIQPVNPWLGNEWVVYTEYYQWSPTYNSNSQMRSASPGDLLLGELKYNGDSAQSYEIHQADLTNGRNSSQTVNVQRNSEGKHKNYTILYIVFEKVWPCQYYPPDQKVTFKNIYVECDGAPFSPTWTTHHVDQACDFEAHVVSPSEVTITWNVNSQKQPTEQQVRKSLQDKDAFLKTHKREGKLVEVAQIQQPPAQIGKGL